MGKEDGDFFFFFRGGCPLPSNSLLNWIVVRAAWILSSKQGTVRTWESRNHREGLKNSG